MVDENAITSLPSPEEMELIRSFLPPGFAPPEPAEVALVSIIAADNLLNRSLGRWPIAAMQSLSSLMPGLPVTLDHEWDAVAKTVGRVISAVPQKLPARSSLAVKALNRHPGNRDINAEILEKEGYGIVSARIFVRSSSPAAEALRFGLLNGVSLGGFVFDWEKVECPLCGVPFLNPRCPHTVPNVADRQEGALLPGMLSPAPYYIRPSEILDMGELSFVLVPRLPGAGVRLDS